MTNQPTDEAAVDIVERAVQNWHRVFDPKISDFEKGCGCLNSSVSMAVADSLREVLNLVAGHPLTSDPRNINAAQLTAATRRAEQAERMLAEAVEALQPFAECVEQISADESGEDWAKFRLLIKDYRRAASIRSAASGEQG